MARKTIDVAYLREAFNKRLADRSTPTSVRRELCGAMEAVLHRTGNYKGWNPLAWSFEGGSQRWRDAGEPENREPFEGSDWRRVSF